MASENARILQQFSETFPQAVNSLTTVLGRFLDQMQSAADTVGRAAGATGGGGGEKSIRVGGAGVADVGGNYPKTIQDQRDRAAKNAYPFAYIAKNPTNPNANPFGNVNKQDAEFLSMPRFGQMTLQDRMKQLSLYLSGKSGYTKQDEQGNAVYTNPGYMKMSNMIGKGADQMGTVQGMAITARNAIMFARNQTVVPVALGVQGGMSRSGSMGTSFMSPAFYSGMQMRAQSLVDSWAGLNPNFTGPQAQDAMRTAASYGYVGGRGTDVQHFLKNIMVNTQLPAGTIMQLADPGLRYGSMTKGDINDLFGTLSNAAASSGIALDALTNQVISATQTLKQVSGGTVGNEALGSAAFTQATGLPAGMLGNLASNGITKWMAYAAAGSPAKFMTASGPQQAMFLLRGQQNFLGLGSIAHQRAMLTNRDPRVRQAFKERLANLQVAGLVPNWSDYAAQVLHYGGAVNSLQAQNMLLSDRSQLRLTGHLAQSSIEAVAQKMHVSMGKVGGGSQQHQLDTLTKLLKQKDASRNTATKNQVTIALDPWAKKLLHLQNPDGVSNRNTSDASQAANYAMTFGSGFVQSAGAGAALGLPFGPAGALIGGVGLGLAGGIGAVTGL